MDNDRIDDAKKHLAAINETIASLDPAIRAGAFELLAPLYFDDMPDDKSPDPKRAKASKQKGKTAASDDPERFFNEHDHDQPKDNVHLIAAWFYSQHGVTPLTQKDVREMADEAGLTIPERPDNTMRSAKVDGKNLYRQKGGGWQTTVKGEAYVKDTYSVKKGNKPRQSAEDE